MTDAAARDAQPFADRAVGAVGGDQIIGSNVIGGGTVKRTHADRDVVLGLGERDHLDPKPQVRAEIERGLAQDRLQLVLRNRGTRAG